MPTEQLMSAQQVADWWRLDVTTIRRMVRRGELPAKRLRRVFRFDRDELSAWLSRKSWERMGNG